MTPKIGERWRHKETGEVWVITKGAVHGLYELKSVDFRRLAYFTLDFIEKLFEKVEE